MSEEKVIGEGYLVVDCWSDGAMSPVTSGGLPLICPDPVSAFTAMHNSKRSVGRAEIVKVRITNKGRWEEIGDDSEEVEAPPASIIRRRRRRKEKGRAT